VSGHEPNLSVFLSLARGVASLCKFYQFIIIYSYQITDYTTIVYCGALLVLFLFDIHVLYIHSVRLNNTKQIEERKTERSTERGIERERGDITLISS
jgi:hypothetical protein